MRYHLVFDGNNKLAVTVANFRSADSSGAIEAWFKSSTATNGKTLLGSSDIAGANNYFQILVAATSGLIQVVNRISGVNSVVTGSTNILDGKWHHIVISSSGTSWTIFLDGIAETLTPSGGGNTGDWFADVPLRDNLTIGVLTSTGNINFAIASMGWPRIYSRQMLAPEALTNFQSGRTSPASDLTGLVFNLPLTEGTGNPVDTVGSLTMVTTGATWTPNTNITVAKMRAIGVV